MAPDPSWRTRPALLVMDLLLFWLFVLYLFLPSMFTSTAGSLYCSWRGPSPSCSYAVLVAALLSPFLLVIALLAKYHVWGVNPELERLSRELEGDPPLGRDAPDDALGSATGSAPSEARGRSGRRAPADRAWRRREGRGPAARGPT